MATSAPSRVRDKCVVKLLRMGEVASNVLEFVMAVLINWRTAIAVVVFAMFSLPNAALSPDARLTFDQKWPVEVRRRWLVRIAVAYVFVSCFLAWDEQRNKVTELQSRQDSLQQRGEIAKKITSFVQEGNQIAKTFEDKDDKDLILQQFNDWDHRCDLMLNSGAGASYAVQFESAKGNGLMLMNHSAEGDGVYSVLQGKLAVLNLFLSEFRPALRLPTPQGR